MKPIGIGVSTHNRLEGLREVIAGIRRYTRMPYLLAVADDGSTDGTARYLAQETGLLIATGPRRGVGWNRNRLIWTLAQNTTVDQFLLLEDDAAPCVPDWDLPWLDAIPQWGFLGYANEAQTTAASGRGTPADPYFSSNMGVQVCAFSRAALNAVGYSDSRFFGPYGHEDTEWRWRFARHFGHLRDHASPALACGIRSLGLPSTRDELSCILNGQIIHTLFAQGDLRSPWHNEDLEIIFRAEMARVRRPVGE